MRTNLCYIDFVTVAKTVVKYRLVTIKPCNSVYISVVGGKRVELLKIANTN